MWNSLSLHDGSDLAYQNRLRLVEKIFEDGEACGDCLHCQRHYEHYEFWGQRGMQESFSCDIINGEVSPFECPGVQDE